MSCAASVTVVGLCVCVRVCVCVSFIPSIHLSLSAGVSTDDVLDDDNAPLMILEYMPYGDLHAFLENNR